MKVAWPLSWWVVRTDWPPARRLWPPRPIGPGLEHGSSVSNSFIQPAEVHRHLGDPVQAGVEAGQRLSQRLSGRLPRKVPSG